MFELYPPTSAPQFLTAEYLGKTPPDHCHICGALIAGSYFRVGRQMACRSCAEKAGFKDPEEHQEKFGRALLYGGSAALLGLAACASLTAISGWTIPVLAVGIGYVVGQSVKSGAPGQGAGRSAFTAALLTYMAVAIGSAFSGATLAAMRSFADLSKVERLVTWSLLALISPFIRYARSDNGLFALLILVAAMLIAAKQTKIEPPSVLGPFFQNLPKQPLERANDAS